MSEEAALTVPSTPTIVLDDTNDVNVTDHPYETHDTTEPTTYVPTEPLKRSDRNRRPSHLRGCITGAYTAFVTIFLMAGTALTGDYDPPDTPFPLAAESVSHKEYVRRNPKWSKVSTGPNSKEWMVADQVERDQMFDAKYKTMEEIPLGAA